MNMHKLYITNGHLGHFCHGSKETDLGHMGSDYQGFGLFNVNLKVNWPKKKIKKKNINILNHHFGQMPKN